MNISRKCALGAAIAATLAYGPARAGSFELPEGSTDWQANAYAGEAAKAYDAGTAWANPAGMVRIDGNEFDGSFNFIDPQFSFSGSNTNFPNPPAQGAAANNVSAIYGAAVPGTFTVISLSPRLKLGLAIKSPFGARIDYPTNWVGRYQALVSSLTSIAVEPSIAYAVTPNFSIGGGPVIDYIHIHQTQAILPAIGYQFGDIIGDAHGDDYNVGYNLGALYQLDAGTRFGLTYRSRSQHHISIQQNNVLTPGLANSPYGPLLRSLLSTADAPGHNYANGYENFNLPDEAEFSAYHDLTPEWTLLGTVKWTHWQLFQHIEIVTYNNNAPVNTVFNFHNTVFASIGASYRPYWYRQLMLQGGFGYDEDPVSNATRQAQIPTENRYLLSVGMTYDLNKHVSLDLAYSHLFAESATINSTGPSPASLLQLPAGQLVGHYNNAIDSFSGGVKVRF